MKADSALITWLLEESGVTRYRISEDTGIKEMTLSKLVNGISKMENITLGTAAALTEYAITKMEEEGIMKIWSRKGYTVEEREFNYSLHKLVIVVDGEDAAEIVPDSIEDMQEVISQLDAGEEAVGMADGQGGDVSIPEYIIKTEDPKRVARGDHAIVEIMRTYSKKEAEKEFYSMNYDEGHTLMLSKLEYGQMELIEEIRA